jgi:hypothetical protein
MGRVLRGCVLAALITGWPALAFGQGSDSGFETFALAGAGGMWEDEGYLGLGWALGGGFGYRVRAVGFEGVVDHRRHTRNFDSGVVFKARAIRSTGRVLYYFRRRPTGPYLGAQIGFSLVNRESNFPLNCRPFGPQLRCDGTERFESSDLARVLGPVAGVRFALDNGWFVRPEFEISPASASTTMSGLVVAGKTW